MVAVDPRSDGGASPAHKGGPLRVRHSYDVVADRRGADHPRGRSRRGTVDDAVDLARAGDLSGWRPRRLRAPGHPAISHPTGRDVMDDLVAALHRAGVRDAPSATLDRSLYASAS